MSGFLPNFSMELWALLAVLLAPTLATVVSIFATYATAKRAAKATERMQDKFIESNVATTSKLNNLQSRHMQTALKLNKIDATNTHTAEALETIHTLVNSRLTEALEKIKQLEALLAELTGMGEELGPPPNEDPK